MMNKKQKAIIAREIGQGKALVAEKFPLRTHVHEVVGILEGFETLLKAERPENDPDVIAIDQLLCDLDALHCH